MGNLATKHADYNWHDSLAVVMRNQYGGSLQPLLPGSTIDILSSIARFLPQSITSLWGYELPLHKSVSVSDFLVCIHKPALLCDAFEAGRLLHQLCEQPAYERLLTLTTRWANREDKLGSLISNCWLEYDYKSLVTGDLRPNFFFGPKPQASVIDVVWATKQIYRLLSSDEVPKGTYRFLLDCLIGLNGQGWISQIGRMLARSENSLRLFIQEVPRGGICAYLQKMNYPYHDHQELVALIDTCYQLADTVDLDIDITDRVNDQIGLECYFDTTERALLFLDFLAEKKLCVPEKYILLRQHLVQIKPCQSGALIHSFSHFKIGFHPIHGLAAKVYMGYVEQHMASKVIRTKPINVL